MNKASFKSLISEDGGRIIKIRPNYSKKTLTVIFHAEHKSKWFHSKYVITLSSDELEHAYRNWSFNDCKWHLSYCHNI